ncbi:MAG: hypothetical protein H7145_22345 [Akkermansiaceae bacterium]|nr:hypothetical protein [Armatimonadota bacterium]
MGLSVTVGMLADLEQNDAESAAWFRGELAKVNRVLEANGTAAFAEPGTLARELRLNAADSYPYSFLHYLRRAYAFQREGLPLTPAGDRISKADDNAIEDAGSGFDSHLLMHSDAEGFYVPVDFDEPIFSDDVPGAMLGSSQGLLRELVKVAPFLGIELTATGELTDTVRQKLLDADTNETPPYYREYVVWHSLYEAARLSIAHQTMIVFH